MLLSGFSPRGTLPLIAALTVIITLFFFGADLLLGSHFKSSPAPEAVASEPSPKHRPSPPPNKPVDENFRAAAVAKSSVQLPDTPSFNKPKQWKELSDASAPLMIGFTRNWPILQQAVVSYLAAGWPASQIHIVENTGTMNSNKLGKLTLQNPFYLDYERLTQVFGVNVITTPTLLTFAQLQNFMMSMALDRDWKTYFWSHMDVAVLSDERYTVADKADPSKGHYSNFFDRVIAKRNELLAKEAESASFKWALHFYAYDRLTLVNLQAYMDVGGWDPLIGYYLSDCDFYERLRMAEFDMSVSDIGLVADVGASLPDLGMFYRRIGWPPDDHINGSSFDDFGTEDERGAEGYDRLRSAILELEQKKGSNEPGGRNFWQSQQQGGQGEPFYKDSEGFERGLWYTIAVGRKIFAEKWGHCDCDLRAQNLGPEDAWRVEEDGDWEVIV